MKFYKENNINPAASCLPLLAQIPIFIALFYVLRGLREDDVRRHRRGDFSWLHFVPNITEHGERALVGLRPARDLRRAASWRRRTSCPATMEKSQRYLMMFLPFVFIPFIVHFPAGLVLYWVTTNLWTVGQGLDHPPADPEGRRAVGRDAPGRSARRAPHRRRRRRLPSPRQRRGAARGEAEQRPAAPREAEEEGAPQRGNAGDLGRGDRRDGRRGEVGSAARAREAAPGTRQGRRALPGRDRGRARSARRRFRAREGGRDRFHRHGGGRRCGRVRARCGSTRSRHADRGRDRRHRANRRRGVRRANHGRLRWLRPRHVDRPARADDRRCPVPRECGDVARHPRRPKGSRRRRGGLPRASPRRIGSAGLALRRPCTVGSRAASSSSR